jgi:hypothetical protein
MINGYVSNKIGDTKMEIMKNYTSGNWKVALGGVCMSKNQRLIISELEKVDGIINIRTIARTFDYGTEEEVIANANLLAAAPNLLSACIDALKQIEELLNTINGNEIGERQRINIEKKLICAIKKATS